MSVTHDSESSRLLGDLVTDADEHGLVLFVGAGVNTTLLPQWNELLRNLAEQAIRNAAIQDRQIANNADLLHAWSSSHFDAYSLASLAKHILGPERYRLEIQDALYGKTPNAEKAVTKYCEERSKGDVPCDNRYEFLWRVAQLCGIPQVKAVATFNYDVLLEYAIQACSKRMPQAHFGGQVMAFGRDATTDCRVLPVFHVHGLLLPPGAVVHDRQESVVLSFDEYLEKTAAPYSWETATPLHLLRSYCTLWLGTSLKDWNMVRLLNAARDGVGRLHSYSLQSLKGISLPGNDAKKQQKPETPEEEAARREFQKIAMRFQATLCDAAGVRLIVAGPEYENVPETLALIRDRILGDKNKGLPEQSDQ